MKLPLLILSLPCLRAASLPITGRPSVEVLVINRESDPLLPRTSFIVDPTNLFRRSAPLSDLEKKRAAAYDAEHLDGQRAGWEAAYDFINQNAEAARKSEDPLKELHDRVGFEIHQKIGAHAWDPDVLNFLRNPKKSFDDMTSTEFTEAMHVAYVQGQEEGWRDADSHFFDVTKGMLKERPEGLADGLIVAVQKTVTGLFRGSKSKKPKGPGAELDAAMTSFKREVVQTLHGFRQNKAVTPGIDERLVEAIKRI